jgi:2-haloacid dehalogenase
MTARPAALVFDAYGTLFDVHSVTAAAESLWPGKDAAVDELGVRPDHELASLADLPGLVG